MKFQSGQLPRQRDVCGQIGVGIGGMVIVSCPPLHADPISLTQVGGVIAGPIANGPEQRRIGGHDTRGDKIDQSF